jgi:magnesium-transporting ATPase (P-type)
MRVPADLRVDVANGAAADESMLTGESVATVKSGDAIVAPDASLGDRDTMLHAGTMLARGRATGWIVGTGSATELGRIASTMQATPMARPPLLVRMDRFARAIAVAVLAISVLVFAIGLARQMETADIFFAVVALAVSAIPEGLPVGLTVALSIATRRMGARNVIARKLVAVEALGSCTFIASDKTGTLTLNELTVTRVALPDGRTLAVEGRGLDPAGAIADSDTLAPDAVRALERIVHAGVACNDAQLAPHPIDGAWVHNGDAVDVALLVLGERFDAERVRTWRQMRELDAIPFDPDLRLAASVRETTDGAMLFVKGAPEQITARSSSVASSSGTREAADGPIDRDALLAIAEDLASQGYRVLAHAERRWTSADPLHLDAVGDLIFLGYTAMIDPLRPEARDAVLRCKAAGVEVAMVTGDHPVTAFAISRELGLAHDESQVVTGAMLRDAAERSEDALKELVGGARVFARVEPAQKLLIVETLAHLGHFVAVTGDGANDAPALRAAHVGVAMGARGTDVAREASTLIITDDNFASLVAGIEEGRVAYGNVRKVAFLLIATGASEVVMFVSSLALGLPLPLLPAQLLWLNLVTNGIQDVALAFEPAEGDEMNRRPRDPRERVFNRPMIERVALTAVTMGLLSTVAFWWFLESGWGEMEARSALLLIFVIFENVLVGAARSESRSVLTLNPLRNKVLLAGTLSALALHVLAMYFGPLAQVLTISPVVPWKWGLALLIALVPFAVLELHGLARRKRTRPRQT